MGVTIYYSGHLKSIQLLDDLVVEMVEVSEANDWKYQIVNTHNQEATFDHKDPVPKLKGISFGSEESESIWFTFNEKGQLLSPMIAMFQHHEPKQITKMDHHAFTKTQSGGPDYHIKIVNIMKYVSKKYFSSWTVKDESQYYESENRDNLVECMTIIDRSLAALNDAFEEHGESMSDKSEEEIKNFIEQILGSEALDIRVIKLGSEEEE